MRRIGLFELHAAGVVEPTTDVGILFIGNSNCGKSTLTTRLANEGWRYLTDDMLILKENGREVEALGLRRNFAISPLVVEGWDSPGLKEALGGPIPSDLTKRYLNPCLVFPDGFIEAIVPRVLLFPLITNEASTRMEKLTQGSAMMKLITFCAWARFDRTVAREYLQTLASLVGQSVSWTLYAGHDLLENPGYAAALLQDHLK